MQRRLAALFAAAALVGGTLFAVAALGPTFASGQEAEEPADPPAERVSWVGEAIGALVEEGVISQEQADAVLEALRDARPERPFGPLPFPPRPAEAIGGTPIAARCAQQTPRPRPPTASERRPRRSWRHPR